MYGWKTNASLRTPTPKHGFSINLLLESARRHGTTLLRNCPIDLNMRILNTTQIRELDAYTIRNEPVASIDLMERASRAFCDWFIVRVDATKKVGIVCGTGNNGGDGLAIARLLNDWGYQVKVWIVRGGVSESADFKTNEERLPENVDKEDVLESTDRFNFTGRDVLIDAVFGSGLSRPPSDIYARVIDAINAVQALKLAVDIPSGLMADSHSTPPIVRADYTISFQLPKLAFMLPECYAFTGDWRVVDIGLHKNFIREAATPYHYTKAKDVRKILRPRSKFDHKGTFGHALIIAGSYGKMGAAVLASKAALRTGVGLLTVHTPQKGYDIIQTSVPEAMAIVDEDPFLFTSPGDVKRYNAVGIGPGLGQDKRTATALARTLGNFGKPVVLDADALNLIAGNDALLQLVPEGSILTPHPKEFERLAGSWKNDFERLEMQRQLAVSLRSVIVLKGAHTSIANKDGQVYFNSTGNPGMATGGTGDVLTGIVTGLLAQNYSPFEAAVAGVFLHGLAGDIAVSEIGMASMIASDLITSFPRAYVSIAKK